MAVLTNISFAFLLSLLPISNIIDRLPSDKTPETPTCIIDNATYFLGLPYIASTLESSGKEKLLVYNDKFDCVTFVEYVLALSLYQTQPLQSKKTINQIITNLRYRDGIINGYGSRLHYFSEWIVRNEKNGTLINITSKISGIPLNKKIHFMTTHKTKYPKLNISEDLQKIKDAEKFLNTQSLTYIPKDKVRSVFPVIQNGDIIAITTGIDGLDIVHTGFAYRKGDDIHLLHASEKEGKVVISDVQLDKYMLKSKSQSGIMVARVK